MSESAIHDYLTQQIKVNRNIVTFRLLSRALSIHINDAKGALTAFYEANKASHGDQPLHATYLISGDDIETKNEEDVMEVDGGQPVLDGPSPMAELVPRSKMMVIPEEKLESSKSLFRAVTGVHIYSVEASRLMDPNLLVTTVDAVRKMDADRSAEELQKLGIPISAACKYNAKLKGKPKAPTTSAPKAVTKATAPVVPKKQPTEIVKAEPRQKLPALKTEPASKSGASGGLDWSKAKKADTTKATTKKATQTEVGKPATSHVKGKGKEPATSESSSVASEPKPKRGIKRPTPPSEDEEAERQQPPKTKARRSSPGLRTKNRVLLSSDEESEPAKKSIRSRPKSEAAMMDWSDDENVVVAARHTPGPPSSRDDGEDDEDEAHSREDDTMDMTDGGLEEEPIYAKTSRAPKKKAWPVGSNGLRKKRVMKTREYKDAKGYLRSEDYSDYESVSSASEEPPEAGKQKKATKKAKEEMKPKVKKEETTVELPKQQTAPARSTKPSTLAAGGRKKTLDSFFAKK